MDTHTYLHTHAYKLACFVVTLAAFDFACIRGFVKVFHITFIDNRILQMHVCIFVVMCANHLTVDTLLL